MKFCDGSISYALSKVRTALVLARVLGEDEEEAPGHEAKHALSRAKRQSGVDPSGKAHASTFHAGEIIATLKSILKKAKKDKYDADKLKQEDRHDYELTSNARKNQINSLRHNVNIGIFYRLLEISSSRSFGNSLSFVSTPSLAKKVSLFSIIFKMLCMYYVVNN